MEQMFNFSSIHKNKLLAIIVAVAFAVSLWHSFYFRIPLSVDAEAYDSYASEIANGRGYPVGAIGRPGPGYEYLLGGIYRVFGRSFPAGWTANALLLSVSAMLAYFISKLIFGASWHPFMGLSAALLVGLSPDFIVLSSMLMTETLEVTLISAFLFSFFKYWRENKIPWLIFSALALAAGTLTRGSALFLFIPALGILGFQKKWKALAVFAVSFFVFMTPWTAHNYLVYGKFRPFNASPGLLWSGNYPGANGELNPKMPYPPGVSNDTMTQDQFDDALFKAGLKQIKTHPFDFIRLTFTRASIYFSTARPTGFWPYLEHNTIARFLTVGTSMMYSLIVFILGIFGALTALKQETDGGTRERIWSAIFFFIFLPLSVIALVVETRYRFPAYVLLAIFSGYGIYRLFSEKRIYLKYLGISALLVTLNMAFDMWRIWQRIIEKISGF